MKKSNKFVTIVTALSVLGSINILGVSADTITRIENGVEVNYYDTYEEYLGSSDYVENLHTNYGDNGESITFDGSYLDWFVQHNTNNMEHILVSANPNSNNGNIILNNNQTIGDSDTIGDSNVTSLRGDVNLDGDVNGLDLLYLKKYLLGLIEW